MNIALILVVCIVALIVGGTVVFELVGWLAERKARERFEKMTPEERFKYQNEMRKKQLYPSARRAGNPAKVIKKRVVKG